MKRTTIQRAGLALGAIISAVSLSVIPAGALAQARAAVVKSGASASDQAKIQLVINRGNNEISRRLNTLNKLSVKINSAARLSAGDKASLTSEVTDEINNLTSLKYKLDADTTLADAKADAKSIITDYRVYALIMPKINLIRTADDQQVAEGKLSSLAAKLQTRVDSAKTAGKNVSSLQTELDNLNAKVSTAQAISVSVESSVINLQPSDYNTDHKVLSGYRDQLKTAQSDIQAALSTAKTIVTNLKNL